MTDPGKNALGLKGFPTPNETPDDQAYLVFYFPNSPEWPQLLLGAAQELANEWNWYQWGALLPEQASEAFRLIIQQAPYNILPADVPTPFWDEDSGDDSDDTAPRDAQPWYGQIVIIDDRLTFIENVGVYLIAGFMAYSGVPSAAIAFIPFARNFIVQFRGNPLGGLIKFFADGQQIGEVDTYSASDTVVQAPVYMPAPTTSLRASLTTTYPTFWVELSEDNPHDLPSVSMTLIRSRLSEADFSNPDQRYNADCDCIQISPDGGTTWNDAPGLDPRHSSAFLKPPVAGTSKQCDAAANMVKWLHDFIDQCIHVFTVGGQIAFFINLLLEFIDLLFPAADFIDLITELAATIFGAGSTALMAAFTSTEYDLLLCIFFCHADSQGRIAASKMAGIEADVTAQLNTLAATVVNAILFIQGEVGLSNAGAIGSETGDCTACTDCQWCYRFDATSGFDTDWTVEWWTVSGCGADAVFADGVWHSTVNPASGGACGGHTVTYLHLRKVLGSTIHLTDAALHISDTSYNRTIWVNGDGSLFSGTEIWNGSYLPTSPVATDSIDILCFLVDVDGAFTVDWAQFSGNDSTNPFGDNNC